jgi:CubicO group peptidase (beta-lactamase class C family)
MARGTFLSEGTFGWSGAFGTHFWVDRKEHIVAIELIQTPNNEFRADFENAVMQSIVGPGVPMGSQH